MATVQELKEMIATITKSTDIAGIQSQIDAVKAKLEENTQIIANNNADDEVTKAAVAENRELITDLVNQLANVIPAPVA